MNVPTNLFMWIMACLPIIVLLLLMIKFQWGATEAAPVGLAITIITGIVFYKADIRLLAAAGFCLGWKTCLIGTITGLFLGGLQSVVLLALGKVRFGERARIPFAPALCLGLFAARLFEDQIVSLFFWGTW